MGVQIRQKVPEDSFPSSPLSLFPERTSEAQSEQSLYSGKIILPMMPSMSRHSYALTGLSQQGVRVGHATV